MKEDQRNIVIFAVLAALVLIGWPLVTSRIFPAANPPVTQVVDGKSKALPAPAGDPATTASPAKLRDRQVVLAETQRVEIRSPLVHGSINLKGAQVDDLSLLAYKETVAKDSPPVTLFSPSGTAQSYYASYGWIGANIALPNDDTVFTPDSSLLAPGHPVTLSWTNPTGQRFDVRFAIDDKYLFTVDQSVTNLSGGAVTVQPYSRLSRTGIPTDLDAATNHIGPIGVFGNGANYDISYKNLQGQAPGGLSFGSTAKAGDNSFNATGGWIGFGDKYWLAALIPDQKAAVTSSFPAARGDTFNANFTLAPVAVTRGQRVTTRSNLFAGAKEVRLLDGYEASLGVPHFGKAIDWGWFEIIEKPIFYYLDWLFRWIGNFGVAIICLTITIRALLFPIAQRQFASMANMRAIQPKMKALQDRYKDDKPRQQQEIMKLYKEEKVNPLAGCLPLLLQIPIMFALYKVLLLATEMRHQPFALWIHDLSVPDPANLGVLVQYLFHFPLLSFLSIGVFPVLLGISMFFQMRLNPAPMDEMQKQIFSIMPWMLMFVMAPFAVGLQLYWITSNCITMLQQSWLYSKHPALKVPVPKKDAPAK